MAFKKSSHSIEQYCVEVDLDFRKSSRCKAADCVEAATTGTAIFVRDSKAGLGAPVLAVSPQAWAAFTGMIA